MLVKVFFGYAVTNPGSRPLANLLTVRGRSGSLGLVGDFQCDHTPRLRCLLTVAELIG